MASIKKRGPSWYLDYRDATGRSRISLGSITKAEAEAALAAKEYELKTGQNLTAPSADAPLFEMYAESYLSWFEQEYPTSFHRVAGIVRNVLVPAFGRYPLDEIKVKSVEDWKLARAKETSKRVKKGEKPGKLKAESVNKELRQLRAMLNKAVEWELITKFPWPKKAVRQLRKDKQPPKFYTEPQMKALYMASGPRRWWWQLYANTGLRKAEGLQFKLADDDGTHARILSLTESGQRTKSGEYRIVPLNAAARKAIDHILTQRGNLMAGDEHSKKPYVWDDEHLLPRVHINSLGRAFARDARRAKIGGNIHRLRHTFCTHLAMNGTPAPVIQELAGHASIETTMGYMWSVKANEQAAVKSLKL